jgi:hypothetical protein
MECSERVVVDPAILVGKPVIRGTRISVEFIMEFLGCPSPAFVGVRRRFLLICEICVIGG